MKRLQTLYSVSLALGALSLASCQKAGGEVPATGDPNAPGAGGVSNGVGGAGNPGGGAGNPGGGAGNPGGGAGNPGGGAGNPGGGAGGDPGGEMVIDGENMDPVTAMSCGPEAYTDEITRPYVQDQAVLDQVNTALNSMDLAAKAEQMRGTDSGSGNNYADIFRSNDAGGVKGFIMRDGPRGVNLDAPYPDGNPRGYSTAFPVPMARGATFDIDLEYRVGVAIGDETLTSQNTLQLAPTINILRHPAWGRAQETYGEDPYHLGRFGTALTVGIQEFLPTCVKHYLGNNVENGRESFNAQMDAQTMREIYGYAYEMVVRDGGVACVMAAYNQVNGTKSTQNGELLNTILRNEWGFKGFVITDWWAMPPGANAGAQPAAYQANATEAVKAGLDMEMPWALNYAQLESLVTAGSLTQQEINTAAGRILEQKYRFNVAATSGTLGLKTPTTGFDGQNITGNEGHLELAREAAAKGMVLLKNDANTLPIDRTTVQTVAVLGASVEYFGNSANGVGGGVVNFATDVNTGDQGSSRVKHNPAQGVGPFAGIQAAGGGINVVSGTTAAEAANADFIVVVAGSTPDEEGEEYTGALEPNGNFLLDGDANGPQNTLIRDAAALGKPMVVVLESGRVVDMPWLAEVPAVVMAWFPGMVGGTALGQLLFGDENFSGKLPFTWPAAWADEPTFQSGGGVQMDYDLGYRHFDRNGISPLFPFGYGLSYTTYEYQQLQLGCTDVSKDGILKVHVDVANTGTVAGEEPILVFVSYPQTAARRPVKELKAFRRVALEPGQAKRVTIPVNVSELKYWDETSGAWVVESGMVDVHVGPNAVDLPLTAQVPIQ